MVFLLCLYQPRWPSYLTCYSGTEHGDVDSREELGHEMDNKMELALRII